MKTKVGIFDSGIGGLTVVAQVFKHLPGVDVIYFGDTARYPYGPRSAEIVRRFSFQNVRFLLSKKVDFVLVACNTASAFALSDLRMKFKVPMMGVIEPGARAAVKISKNKRIGVIGTVGTIASRSYPEAIRKIDKDMKVFAYACPLLVALAEEGCINKQATGLIVGEYLKPLIRKKVDTLILGCTHYPLLKKVIAGIVGQEVRLVDSSETIALELKRRLAPKGMGGHAKNKGTHTFFVSDAPQRFMRVSEKFLGRRISKVQKVEIDRY